MKVVETFHHKEIKGFKFGRSLFGKPTFYSHIYFIDGLLIDTGHRKMSKSIFATIKDLPVEQIFITHFHEDHSGNIAMLQNHFDCPVYGSQKCSEIMKAPPAISWSQKMAWGDRPSYKQIIPSESSIKTSDYNFTIYDTPGHAVDMVVLYEPSKKWLFSADLYVNSFIGYFLREESLVQQINSITEVLKLDFDVLLCGHNPQLKNGKAKLQKKLSFLQKFNDNVVIEYKKGKNAKEIMKVLNLREFRQVKVLSRGALSRENMVASAIRDYEVKLITN